MTSNGKPVQATESRGRRREPELRTVSVCTPAVRLVLIEANVDLDGNPFHDLHPVLCVTATVYGPDDRQHASVEPGVLFLNEEGTIDQYPDPWEGSDAAVYRLVPCPWPPDEDAVRLADIIRDVEQHVSGRTPR
jgi:hypothetical protein